MSRRAAPDRDRSAGVLTRPTRRTFNHLLLLSAAGLVRPADLLDEGSRPGPKAGVDSRIGKEKRDPLRVAVLYYDMAILFDYAPAVEIFRVAEGFRAFEVYSVSAGPNPVPAMFPRKLYADFLLGQAPPPDIVIVPGGAWSAMKSRRDVARWLRGVLNQGGTLMAVCSGGYLLAQWGFLDGLPVTGTHVQLDLLRSLAPKARIFPEVPFVDAGQIVTTAGAATSLDAALHLVRRFHGEPAAAWIARKYLDYDGWNSKYEGIPPNR